MGKDGNHERKVWTTTSTWTSHLHPLSGSHSLFSFCSFLTLLLSHFFNLFWNKGRGNDYQCKKTNRNGESFHRSSSWTWHLPSFPSTCLRIPGSLPPSPSLLSFHNLTHRSLFDSDMGRKDIISSKTHHIPPITVWKNSNEEINWKKNFVFKKESHWSLFLVGGTIDSTGIHFLPSSMQPPFSEHDILSVWHQASRFIDLIWWTTRWLQWRMVLQSVWILLPISSRNSSTRLKILENPSMLVSSPTLKSILPIGNNPFSPLPPLPSSLLHHPLARSHKTTPPLSQFSNEGGSLRNMMEFEDSGIPWRNACFLAMGMHLIFPNTSLMTCPLISFLMENSGIVLITPLSHTLALTVNKFAGLGGTISKNRWRLHCDNLMTRFTGIPSNSWSLTSPHPRILILNDINNYVLFNHLPLSLSLTHSYPQHTSW